MVSYDAARIINSSIFQRFKKKKKKKKIACAPCTLRTPRILYKRKTYKMISFQYNNMPNQTSTAGMPTSSAPFMNDIAVSKDGVIKLLKGLNPSKALGPDELPRVLKELAT